LAEHAAFMEETKNIQSFTWKTSREENTLGTLL